MPDLWSTAIPAIRAVTFKRWLQVFGLICLALVLTAAFLFRDQIVRASLDPKTPFQTYRPPPAPDYTQRPAWALLPADPPASGDSPLDVFFIHPTTYNGGEEWNGPIDYPRAARELTRVMLPNYAGPFARVGRVFAPRYRQASVYAMLSFRDDAHEARAFAYGDVRQAFRSYLARYNHGRPFIVAGVEQGGSLAARLVREEIDRDPGLHGRLAAAYLIRAVVPADDYGPGAATPACASRAQAGCVVAYAPVTEGDSTAARRTLARAFVWNAAGELQPLGQRPALCVNPVTGSVGSAPASERDNLGAANATDLEWGLRPAFLPHQAAAQCRDGLLRVSRPKSPSLKPAGGWIDRQKPPGFNLFYADLEADALARLKTLQAAPGFHLPAPPITTSIEVRRVPLMGRR